MSDRPAEFGRVPRDLILSGRLAASGADRVELLVLLGIAAHADEHFRGYPSMVTLAKAAGVTDRSARRAIRRLEAHGVISSNTGRGGRHKANTYQINPDAQGVLVSSAKPGHPERPGIDEKPGRLDAETRTPAALNPDVCDTKPGRARRPPNRGTEEQRRTRKRTKAAPTAQASLPGIAPPQAAAPDPSPAWLTFPTTAGPWSMTAAQRDKLRDEFCYVHVDTELASLADWCEHNPTKRKTPAAMWSWLRRLMAKKQAERPLATAAYYSDGFQHTELPTDPTLEELREIMRDAEQEAA